MEVIEKEIRFYQTLDGKIPFQEWRDSLDDAKARDLVRARLARLRAGKFGDCKSVGHGVFELRIFHGPGIRIYFGQVTVRKLLMLSAGTKETQERDIQKAWNYWEDYRRRV